MKKTFLFFLLLFWWELPQHILALFIYLIFGVKKSNGNSKIYKSCWVIRCRKIPGVSLGRFIFLNDYNFDRLSIVKHEYGHSLQSILLGWLYLIVIGIPSFGNNYFWRKSWYGKKSYYSLYPERWADVWGGADNRK